MVIKIPPPPRAKDIVDTPLTADITCSKHTRSRLVLNVLEPIYSSKCNIITSVASLLSVGDGKNSTQKKCAVAVHGAITGQTNP